MGAAIEPRRQPLNIDRRSYREQIPPDLVVKYQAIDIFEVIFSLVWQRNIVQTSCRNRKLRCELLSLSGAYRSTTKSGRM
jgi:hypothetical protein